MVPYALSDVSYSVSFVMRGQRPRRGQGPIFGREGLTRVFRDGKASEAAEEVPDTVESLRKLKPAGRASKPAGRALDPVARASEQTRRASLAVGRALDPA